MLYQLYDALLASPLIQQKVETRIKFYEYPPIDNMEGVYIVIDPLATPRPGDYADNKPMTDEYFYQIEVWSQSFEDTQRVAKEVRIIMTEVVGFSPYGDGIDEYEPETAIFRDARRYIGKEYIVEI